MAKIKTVAPVPTTPEELAALSAPPAPASPAVPPQLAAIQGGGQRGAMPVAPDTGATPPELERVAGGAQHSFPGQTGADLRAQIEPAVLAPPNAPLERAVAPGPAKPAVSGADFLTRFANQKTPQSSEQNPKKPKGEFWRKLGTVAKNTGRTVAELLQAAMFGWGGVDQPLQYQIRQEGERQAGAKEKEQAFQQRMDEINREWQAAQYRIRDESDLQREKMRLDAQAQQAQADRASSEKIAGLKSGAIPGEDPVQAWLRQTFGGGK